MPTSPDAWPYVPAITTFPFGSGTTPRASTPVVDSAYRPYPSPSKPGSGSPPGPSRATANGNPVAVAAVPTITVLFPWCVIAEHADEVVVGNVRTARPPVPKVPSTRPPGR